VAALIITPTAEISNEIRRTVHTAARIDRKIQLCKRVPVPNRFKLRDYAVIECRLKYRTVRAIDLHRLLRGIVYDAERHWLQRCGRVACIRVNGHRSRIAESVVIADAKLITQRVCKA